MTSYRDNETVFRITVKKQLKSLSTFFFYMLMYLVIGYWGYYKINSFLPAVWAFLVTSPFNVLPAFLLHIEYLIRNGNGEYEFQEQRIIRRKKGVETICSFEDIEVIVLYLNPALFRYDSCVRAHECYHFAKILMKSGEVLYLTSLLYPAGIEEIIQAYMKGVPYWRVKRIICTTLYNGNFPDVDKKSDKDEKDYYRLFKEDKAKKSKVR